MTTYTIIDADTQTRFTTTDWESKDAAERRLNELNLTYGKEFCLRLAVVEPDNNSPVGYTLVEI